MFQANELQVSLTNNAQEKPDHNNLVFGHHTSDHMLEIDWSEKHGWAPPVIKPLQNLSLHPAARIFHYATGVCYVSVQCPNIDYLDVI